MIETVEARSVQEIADKIKDTLLTIAVIEEDLETALLSIEDYDRAEKYVDSLRQKVRTLKWTLNLL